MTVPRNIARSLVKAMLEECAPDHGWREATHSIVVAWNGRTYPLPKGRHGKKEAVEIGTSQVRTMVRQLEIPEECARRMMPTLAQCFKRKLKKAR